jgi:hypothetical protein
MKPNLAGESFTAMERATLRLTRGVSRHVGWLLSNGCGSSLITVGASPSSDWQILAPGVPGHAMSIGFVDGALCACSGHGARVSVNGRLLPEALQRIDGPVVFAVGNAEFTLARDDAMAAGYGEPERGRETWPDPPARSSLAHRWSGDRAPSGSEGAWRASHVDLPSVLGREAGTHGQVGPLQSIASFTFVAVSYLAWLYLLDHF